MTIETLGIIGAGQMGAGIAQVASMSGLDVIMNDIQAEFVEKGFESIARILSRNVEKGKISEEEKNNLNVFIDSIFEKPDFSKILIK